MEEIWKDIPNLSSLQNPNSNFEAMNLQDFLARPFMYPNYNHLNLTPVFQSTPPAETNLFPAGHASNNVVLCRAQGNSLSSHSYHHPVSNMTSSTQQHLGVLGMQTSSGGARKRIALLPNENDDQNNASSHHDRRYQRLIKNRESAARSRDRKEAHTSGLENELKILKAENARLRKEQELRDAAQSYKKKHTLNRSSSSPF